MSSGVASNCANGNPVLGCPSTTRRRVSDLPTAPESDSNNSSSSSDHHALAYNDEEADNPNGYIPSSRGSHFLQSMIRNLLLRMMLFSLFSWVSDTCHWAFVMAHSLRSGRNAGRNILSALLLVAVVLFFLKAWRISNHAKWGRDNGLLILQTFAEDRTLAQHIIAETNVESQAEHSMPKGVIERVRVCFWINIEQLISTFFGLLHLDPLFTWCYVLRWRSIVHLHEYYVISLWLPFYGNL